MSSWLLGFSDVEEGRQVEAGARFWARRWFESFGLVSLVSVAGMVSGKPS
jgi:hypothetical protein